MYYIYDRYRWNLTTTKSSKFLCLIAKINAEKLLDVEISNFKYLLTKT